MAAEKCSVFLVTGPPGVGKTTLIMRVFERLIAANSKQPFKLRGFYTREIREGSQRVGFQVVTLDGLTAPLASILRNTNRAECSSWPTVGRFKVDVQSFESLALPQLQVSVREYTDLFIVDEVGKMELYSSSFFPAILKILESNVPILASVPIPKSGRDIPAVARLKNHPGATIFTLTPSNRDALKDQIYSQLVELLTKK